MGMWIKTGGEQLSDIHIFALSIRTIHKSAVTNMETRKNQTAAQIANLALLTVKDVAEILNVSVRTVEYEIAEGRLIPFYIRGARRFSIDYIYDYLHLRCSEGRTFRNEKTAEKSVQHSPSN